MLPNLTKITIVSFLAILLLGLQGCITTAVVGTAAVATKVATDPRTVGRQLDDETLEEKVAYNLNKDAQLQEEARINIVVYNGNVLLIGQAPNEMAKEAAKSIAAGVNGVHKIYNQIRISPKISIAQIAKDNWITAKIKSKLLVNSEVKATDVKIITENGEIFILGDISRDQLNTAANDARVDGAKKVIKVELTPK